MRRLGEAQFSSDQQRRPPGMSSVAEDAETARTGGHCLREPQRHRSGRKRGLPCPRSGSTFAVGQER